MPRRPTLLQLWVPATVALGVIAAGVVILSTDKVAQVNPDDLVITTPLARTNLGTPEVTYSVSGSGPAELTYLDSEGAVIAVRARLPWTIDVVLPSPMRSVGVTVTGASGADPTCEIVIDGERRDHRAAEPGTGITKCTVIAA